MLSKAQLGVMMAVGQEGVDRDKSVLIVMA